MSEPTPELEKMARAIFVDDFGGRADALWESADEEERDTYRSNARAALMVIRVPTEAMMDQIIFAEWCPTIPDGVKLYQAMIDAILGEQADG